MALVGAKVRLRLLRYGETIQLLWVKTQLKYLNRFEDID